MQKKSKTEVRPPQKQRKPGVEEKMTPVPESEPVKQSGGKLQGKVAIITGGDSGIGKATAILFAQEGCDVAVPYLSETVVNLYENSSIEKYLNELDEIEINDGKAGLTKEEQVVMKILENEKL